MASSSRRTSGIPMMPHDLAATQPEIARPGLQHAPAHPLWPILGQTQLAVDPRGCIRAALAPEVLGLADRPMTISGYLAPLENRTSFRHFLLSRYSPLCPCCPAGGLNEVVEVFTALAVAPTSAMVVMSGVFSVQDELARGRFYHLTEARVDIYGGRAI